MSISCICSDCKYRNDDTGMCMLDDIAIGYNYLFQPVCDDYDDGGKDDDDVVWGGEGD